MRPGCASRNEPFSKAGVSFRGGNAMRTYSAEKVRQGEIILKRPWQRAVFISGLSGIVVLVAVVLFFF